MSLSRLSKRILGWFGRAWTSDRSAETAHRGPRIHVIVLDGTMSSLEPGHETHAGVAYKLCKEIGGPVSVYYEAGIQWRGWKSAPDVLLGRGINRQIQRAYGYLASRYRPGDKIIFLGYSRGAFAVRSLAGAIGMVGLLRPECATERNIRNAYRHYQGEPDSPSTRAFAERCCHPHVEIEMIGVWDTVKALGLRLPYLWQFSEPQHSFHNHRISDSVKHGFHALALDERRSVYTPVLWHCPDDGTNRIEQVWFRGTHGDVGGQLAGFEPARPLANISLVWMLDKAQSCGLPLPDNWRLRFFTDPKAPSSGSWRGWAKIFWLRRDRIVGQDPSERLHETVIRNSDFLGQTPKNVSM